MMKARIRLQNAYVLLPVVVAIALVATIAYLSSLESGLGINMANSEFEATQADYLAQAGLQHAIRETARQGCGPYSSLTNVAFNSDQYSTTLTTDLGATTSYTVNADQDTWIKSNSPSANYASDWKLHVRFEGGIIERPLYRYDLSAIPANSPILSATAWFHINKEHPEGPLDVHLITQDWQASTATWNTMGDKIDPAVINSIPAQDSKFIKVPVNLTGQVQAWVNGQANYGITLNSTSEGIYGEYSSNEDFAANRSTLEVIVGTAPTPVATLKSVGMLANGVVRSITRDDVALSHKTPLFTLLQPGPAGTDDGWMTNTQTGWNYGGSTLLNVNEGGGPQRGIIRFDLANALPRGANLVSATLELYATSVGGTGYLRAYGLQQDWVEGTCSGGGGCSDGATWATTDGSIAWSTPGGTADASAASEVQGGLSNAWYALDITAVARNWISGTGPNYGLLLQGEGVDFTFNSSDHSDTTTHPRIHLHYSCDCGISCFTPQGSGNILFVVDNEWGLTAAETRKKALFESWGYTVDLISDYDVSWNFVNKAPNNDLVYVSSDINASQWGVDFTLAASNLPIVNEKGGLNNALGISSSFTRAIGSTLTLTDTSHPITQVFAPGKLRIFEANMSGVTTAGGDAPGLQTLADGSGAGTWALLEKGAALFGGGTAPGARVMLPIGLDGADFNIDYLNNNGLLMLQRSIAWTTGALSPAKPLLFVSGGMTMVQFPSGDLVPIPTAQEQLRIDLIESWGYQVNLISDDDTQANFDIAVSANNIIYISGETLDSSLGSKLIGSNKGIVNEQIAQHDELGFSQNTQDNSFNMISVVDNSHDITTGFATGWLQVATSDQPLLALNGTLAAGLKILAETWISGANYDAGLSVIDKGGAMYGGGSAAGRRVQLPWGAGGFDFSSLNDNGQTIMQRAIEWAMQVSPVTGPIAHWKLDDASGNTAVDSVGGHDGSITTPLWSEGALGGGLEVTAASNAAIVPHDDKLSITDKLTVMAWVKKQNLSGYDAAIVKATTGADINYFLGTYANEVVFGFSTDNDNWKGNYSSGANLQTLTWYHIAASFDNANDKIKVYLDGNPILDVNTPFEPLTNTGNVMLGNSAIGELLSGRMDDARIYDRVLSDAEIAELATLPPPELLAHWKLDETSGALAADSGGAHDGTFINGTPNWVTGTIDGALEFDGIDDVVIVPDDPALDLHNRITLQAWIRPNATGTQYIIRKAQYDVTDGYELSLSTSGKVFFRLNQNSSANTFRIDSTSDYPTDGSTWMHIAATYDGITQRLYINGVEEASQAASIAIGINNSDLSLGGQVDGTRVIDGLIDDARLYYGALSAVEIATIAAGGGGSGSSGCNGSYRDDFDAVAWDGSIGSLDWSATPWTEIGESDGTGSGDIQIVTDVSNYQLQIKDNDKGIERPVNLDGAGSATLKFKYRRDGLDNGNDEVRVYASSNGIAGPYTELPAPIIEGAGTDGAYLDYQRDISAYISSNTAIRLLSNNRLGNNDKVFFDDLQVDCSP